MGLNRFPGESTVCQAGVTAMSRGFGRSIRARDRPRRPARPPTPSRRLTHCRRGTRRRVARAERTWPKAKGSKKELFGNKRLFALSCDQPLAGGRANDGRVVFFFYGEPSHRWLVYINLLLKPQKGSPN